MLKYVGLISLGLALFVAGCQPVASPVMGAIYLDASGPVAAGQGAAMREGQACAQSILGLFATGDASIAAAMQAGGIQQIAWVDHHSTSTLGIVAQYCTIVHGK